MKKSIYILILTFIAPMAIWAQKGERQLVQISGFCLASDSLVGIPFVHIGIKHSSIRYGEARVDGFFSFAVAEGDTLIFTSLGYYPATYIVPAGNQDNKLSIIEQMNKNVLVGPTTVIYPWGSREMFNWAFVHTKIPRGLTEIAKANTDRQLLAAIGLSMPTDGGEATQRYMQYQAVQASYYNQQAPQNIFNPLAWADFIKALKNGDFKQKPAPTAPAVQQDY